MANRLAAESPSGNIRTICLPIGAAEYRRIVDDSTRFRPDWALAHVFGHDAMYWYRLDTGLGRNSTVGTTVRRAALPEQLLAEPHHQTPSAEKNDIATTAGKGVVLGAAVAETAGTDDWTAAYAVFRDEARNVQPDDNPKSVNTDGWKGTKAAWKCLFPMIFIIRCHLHGSLKIPDRAKHLKETFAEISERVWDAYHAPDRRTFSQRIRALKSWASQHLSGVVLEKVVDLCNTRELWGVGYEQPGCHRTSNMLDRLMRSMNRYFDNGQHLHGPLAASERHCHSWALLRHFAPGCPEATRNNAGWRSPAERLNKHRYHDNWLHNPLVSASLGGYRIRGPPKT